ISVGGGGRLESGARRLGGACADDGGCDGERTVCAELAGAETGDDTGSTGAAAGAGGGSADASARCLPRRLLGFGGAFALSDDGGGASSGASGCCAVCSDASVRAGSSLAGGGSGVGAAIGAEGSGSISVGGAISRSSRPPRKKPLA